MYSQPPYQRSQRPQNDTPVPQHSPKNKQAIHPPQYISYNSSPAIPSTHPQSAPSPPSWPHPSISSLYPDSCIIWYGVNHHRCRGCRLFYVDRYWCRLMRYSGAFWIDFWWIGCGGVWDGWGCRVGFGYWGDRIGCNLGWNDRML